MRSMVQYWRVRRLVRRSVGVGPDGQPRPAIGGGAFELPSLPRMIGFAALVLLLGLAGAIAAFANEIVQWLQAIRVKFEQSSPPAGAALVVLAGYLKARLNR